MRVHNVSDGLYPQSTVRRNSGNAWGSVASSISVKILRQTSLQPSKMAGSQRFRIIFTEKEGVIFVKRPMSQYEGPAFCERALPRAFRWRDL
jgi:hypothetical protein